LHATTATKCINYKGYANIFSAAHTLSHSPPLSKLSGLKAWMFMLRWQADGTIGGKPSPISWYRRFGLETTDDSAAVVTDVLGGLTGRGLGQGKG